MRMYRYEFKPLATKQLKKLPKDVQRQIIKKLEFFLSTPDPLVFASKLINRDLGEYRFRAGDYRIIFDVEGQKIIVVAVGHRKEIYR